MIIYITENIINNKKYIGLDSKNNPKYLGSGKHLKRSIKKYGKENFIKTIIENCSSLDELSNRECYWIDHYDAINSKEFYNLAEGGKGGWLGDEANKKRIATLTGYKHSEETKRKIGEKAKGREVSDETRKKMSESQSGTIRHKDKSKLEGSNNPNSKKIAQYTLDGELVRIWDCIKDATDFYGKPGCKSHISSCARGKRNRTMGFKWGYLDK